MKNLLSLMALSACLLAATAATAQQPAYTVRDLGDLGGGYSVANAINSSGDIVGFSTTATGRTRPFLCHNGAMQDLGTLYGLAGTPDFEHDIGNANSISDNGQIVGTTYKFTQNNFGGYNVSTVGFRYRNGTLTEFDSGATESINNAGQSVGYGRAYTGPYYATLNSNGVNIDLGLGNGSSARAINNRGQIVGEEPNYGPYLYQNGAPQKLSWPAGYDGGQAHAISENGLVAGSDFKSDGTLSGQTHAALWKNGQAFDLGTLGGKNSTAYGVNSAGVVVGEADRNLVNQLQSTAFVYENGAMHDLFAGTGWSGGSASAINDAGEIVGVGIHNGQIHAFLAIPAATPEPGAFALFAAGILTLGGLARRRVRAA